MRSHAIRVIMRSGMRITLVITTDLISICAMSYVVEASVVKIAIPCHCLHSMCTHFSTFVNTCKN
jgi:hypothetical protein